MVMGNMGEYFAKFPEKTYKKKTVLIQPGLDIDCVYYIEKGVVRAHLISTKGNDVTINFIGKGVFFRCHGS